MPYEWYFEGFTNDFNEKECSNFCSTSGTDYFCNHTTHKCEEYSGRSGGSGYVSCTYACVCETGFCPAVGSPEFEQLFYPIAGGK